ncbi:hypothetical protein RchiOBHm_Chr4g0388271 [Rosa chinensis]|uniref:Uncharacterized protein n=1 Tax=Rosa chinensis TaxID=74649 RepID=A0A2P6QPN7_ROSCH|nr:hypothetical protein RchiOBHm_Chr4g0388271 [Rosa chinensis]
MKITGLSISVDCLTSVVQFSVYAFSLIARRGKKRPAFLRKLIIID